MFLVVVKTLHKHFRISQVLYILSSQICTLLMVESHGSILNFKLFYDLVNVAEKVDIPQGGWKESGDLAAGD